MSEDNKRAYNAILTLLDDSEPPQIKKPKKTSEDPKPSLEENTEAVEGYESEHSDNEEDEVITVEDDNEGDSKDPFEVRFAHPKNFDPPTKWQSELVSSLPLLGTKSLYQYPDPAIFPKFLTPCSSKKVLNHVKHRLIAPFERTNAGVNGSGGTTTATKLQQEYASVIMNYQDVLISNRTHENSDEYLNLTMLHLINHIYKTRDRVLKNNTKKREAGNEDLDQFRDQGFTRAKVLVLLPTRHSAYEFVQRISRISGLSQVENQKRFKENFYAPDADLKTKPEDFQQTFAGNTNEVFSLGVKFTRQAVKLYSSFYSCDMIIASPLGLRLIVDKKDFDFLSSIEVCLVDQADVIAMQSWTNMNRIFDKLNLVPRNPHDCDFSRLREWYLDDKAKFLRQTIVLSNYATPEITGLLNKRCHNVSGKFRARYEELGIISSLKVRIKQVFQRLSSPDFKQDAQIRMDYFTNSLLPSLMRGAETDGILVVAPNYTDFITLRNFLERQDYQYVSLSEYTGPSQLGRGRTFFANKRAQIMLYSARLHHYRRYGIKGTKNVVFFGLPDNPLFYLEIVRFLARTVLEQQVDPDLLSVHVLFSKWDALKLERVVGTKRMGQLMEGLTSVHEFY